MDQPASPDVAVVPLGGRTAVPAPMPEPYGDGVQKNNRLTLASWRLIVKQVSHEFFLHAMMDRGAVLSFFSVLTFVPTVVSGYSVATLIMAKNREQVTGLTNRLINDYVPEGIADNARDVVDMIVGTTAQSTIMLIISLLFAMFSASAYVRAFARAANAVYGRMEGRGLVFTWLTMWLITIVLVVGTVLILVAFLLQGSLVRRFLEPIAGPLHMGGIVTFLVDDVLPVWFYLRWPVMLVVGISLIAMLYHFAPNVRPPRFRWLTCGSGLAAAGTSVAFVGFSLYLNYLSGYSAYGALGTGMAFLFALWMMNTSIVLGVKVDAEILRARELQQGLDAESVILAPPRATASAINYKNNVADLAAQGRALKESRGRSLKPRSEGK